MPTSFSVANEAQLNAAIQQIDVGGASAATNAAYSITLTAGFRHMAGKQRQMSGVLRRRQQCLR